MASQTVQTVKYRRQKYFIDRKLQGRYMLTFFLPMVIMLGFMLGTLYFEAKSIINTASRMLSRNVENTVVLALQDRTASLSEECRDALSAVKQTVKKFPQSKELKDEMFKTLLWVFSIGFILVAAQLVFLTVFFSHKIAGPIYRFEYALKECISSGRYNQAIKLRRGDEMQNFADLLNAAQQATRQRFIDLINAESDEKRKAVASTLQL